MWLAEASSRTLSFKSCSRFPRTSTAKSTLLTEAFRSSAIRICFWRWSGSSTGICSLSDKLTRRSEFCPARIEWVAATSLYIQQPLISCIRAAHSTSIVATIFSHQWAISVAPGCKCIHWEIPFRLETSLGWYRSTTILRVLEFWFDRRIRRILNHRDLT